MKSGGGDSQYYATNGPQYKAGAAAGSASGSTLAGQFAVVELLTSNVPIHAVFSSAAGQAIGGVSGFAASEALRCFARRLV